MVRHNVVPKAQSRQKVIELLMDVGIPDAADRYSNYPHQFSGGMRQRVVIAIAMACQPDILICDEPTTALDVTIQAQIIDLIKVLQRRLNLTVIYITHDLGVVAEVADRVAIMYAGEFVEVGTAEEVFFDPKHPYTWALLSSLPQFGEKGKDLFTIEGVPPNLYKGIVGDAFAPRNRYAMEIDFVEAPPYFQVSETHRAKTWLLDSRAPRVSPPEAIEKLRAGVW
jgi:oligopeptide transport system ATP-binding protein